MEVFKFLGGKYFAWIVKLGRRVESRKDGMDRIGGIESHMGGIESHKGGIGVVESHMCGIDEIESLQGGI